MAIIFKKIMRELFVSALIYIMIAWMAVVFVFLTIVVGGYVDEAFMWVITIGIGGCFYDECFAFPFAPLLAIFGLVFVIVRYSRLTEYFVEGKKKFLIIYSIVFLVVGIPIWFDVTRDYIGHRAYRKEYAVDEVYYWNKYGTEEEIAVPYKFIYPGGDAIFLKDGNGFKEELASFPNLEAGKKDIIYTEITYPSPRNTYHIRDTYLDDYRNRIVEVTHTWQVPHILDTSRTSAIMQSIWENTYHKNRRMKSSLPSKTACQ